MVKEQSAMEEKINTMDQSYKERMKAQATNRNTKEHSFIIGDYVLVRQQKQNKWTPPYETTLYNITEISGPQITARRTTDGRIVKWHRDKFKLANAIMEHQGNLDDNNDQEHNWREELLHNITQDEPEPALAPACETPKQIPPSPAKRQ